MLQKDEGQFWYDCKIEILACFLYARRVVAGVTYSRIDVQLVEYCINRNMPVY